MKDWRKIAAELPADTAIDEMSRDTIRAKYRALAAAVREDVPAVHTEYLMPSGELMKLPFPVAKVIDEALGRWDEAMAADHQRVRALVLLGAVLNAVGLTTGSEIVKDATELADAALKMAPNYERALQIVEEHRKLLLWLKVAHPAEAQTGLEYINHEDPEKSFAIAFATAEKNTADFLEEVGRG